jgi:hypothetical protein
MSLHTEFLSLFENAALLREILTWGRESSRHVQDLIRQILYLPTTFSSPKVKFPLKGRHFQTVKGIQCAVTRELNNISIFAFLEGMKKLKERANKCIDQGGIYFEE